MTGKAAQIVHTKKAVVFDLFHTLVSLKETWGDRLPRVHEMLGVSREAWSEQLERRLDDLYTGRRKDAYRVTAEMARAIDPAIPDTAIRTAAAAIVDTFAGALVMAPAESIEVLTSLKARGKRIGLVSNASTLEVGAWDRSPMAPLFDCAIFSCYVGYVKPDRRIYEACVTGLGVVPGECAFVGDGGSGELEGARNVGMAPIMVAEYVRDMWPGKIEERKRQADVMIERLSELL